MTNSPTPRLEPDRPSDAAIAQAFWNRWTKAAIHLEAALDIQRIKEDAEKIDAAAPPAEAPAERGEAHFWLIERACAAAIGGSEWAGMHPVSKAAARNRLHALLAAAPAAPAEGVRIPAGTLISVDVSTGDDDAQNRIFARATGEVMDRDDDPVVLCIEEERNFTAPRVTGGREDSTDAARYRWLVANCSERWSDAKTLEPTNCTIEFSGPGHDLPAAIDAAMKDAP